MSTEGISLNIVENSTSDKLTRGDPKKAWGSLERRWNPKTREDKVQFYTKFLHYKLENVKQRQMDWLAFIEKKRNELVNTGHVEKPLFSIGLISFCADQFNSCALLQSGITCLHVSFTAYEYFYKLSKSASFSRWLLHPVTQKNQ